MTNPTPHRATPEQWAEQERWASDEWANSDSCCIIELRDRLAAAEQRISELEGNSSAALTGSNHPAKPDSSTPAGSLVEVVMDALEAHHVVGAIEGSWGAQSRAAIQAMAEWLDSQNVGAGRAAARWLREEVERHD